MAELICSIMPSIEKVRMVNSGTEATMSAIRVARGYTGKDKFIKIEGCYHGHGDSFLIAAGSGALTFGSPDSPGVTKGTAKDTLIAPFNNLSAIEEIISKNRNSRNYPRTSGGKYGMCCSTDWLPARFAKAL